MFTLSWAVTPPSYQGGLHAVLQACPFFPLACPALLCLCFPSLVARHSSGWKHLTILLVTPQVLTRMDDYPLWLSTLALLGLRDFWHP
ncbi:hypothetical protein FKM82_018052 [Ascaphus truei]